ncbi:hypothetical protein Vadar_008394 [Vaccinium darrowii]|uniref:Uncharacterized protein n=1 Tax=Vaccinium darrowii TaxID=229202 RepID=A0ACB7YK25_9ERIC|nr:hypothetical protein Vadar_008394 [Vaccinium darrowii]
MASNTNAKSPIEKYPYPTEFNVLDFVPKLLGQANYEKWKKLMRDFIERRGLIGFIDGTAQEGDWNEASGIIDQDPDAVRTRITQLDEAALTVGIRSRGRNYFVRKLLEKMTPQDVVNLVDDNGDTTLHIAANTGNFEGAKCRGRSCRIDTSRCGCFMGVKRDGSLCWKTNPRT